MDDYRNRDSETHEDQPILMGGAPLESARGAMILLHGRGGTSRDILSLTSGMQEPGFVYIAPQAAKNTWYPYSFLSPIEKNEAQISSVFGIISTLIDSLTKTGIPPEQIILLGFSQGGCLAVEFAMRNPRRYGGVVSLGGGLIGTKESLRRPYPGSLANTPIFFGSSDKDPHMPQERIHLSAEILQNLGGEVTTRIYPNMGHTVNEDEMEMINIIMHNIVKTR